MAMAAAMAGMSVMDTISKFGQQALQQSYVQSNMKAEFDYNTQLNNQNLNNSEQYMNFLGSKYSSAGLPAWLAVGGGGGSGMMNYMPHDTQQLSGQNYMTSALPGNTMNLPFNPIFGLGNFQGTSRPQTASASSQTQSGDLPGTVSTMRTGNTATSSNPYTPQWNFPGRTTAASQTGGAFGFSGQVYGGTTSTSVGSARFQDDSFTGSFNAFQGNNNSVFSPNDAVAAGPSSAGGAAEEFGAFL